MTSKSPPVKVNDTIRLVGPRSERCVAGEYSIRRSEGSGGWKTSLQQKYS